MAFIYDLTDTWNAGGTTFNAIKMNVTDSASAAASRLISLQVGGAERFGVDKAGIGSFASVVRAAAGSTSAPAFSFTADTNTGMWSPSSDAIAFSTAGSERLRLDSSGNVGIGTSSPGFRLDVSGTGRFTGLTQFDNDVTLNKATLNYLYFNDAISFSRNGVGERMRIDSSGNVGIGTGSPAARLDVIGNIFSRPGGGSGAVAELTADASSGANGISLIAGFASGGFGPIRLLTSSTERMRIDSSGNVGIGTSSPGKKLTVAASTDQLSLTTGTNELIARASSSEAALYTFQAIPLNFYTNNAERMRIDSSGNVGIGTSSPNAAARLDVTSTTSGFLPPRMTTAQRDAIGSPPNGLMLYNTSTDKLQVRAAGSWVDLH